MPRKTSTLPTKIYRYGAPTSGRHDVTGRALIEEELRRLQRYRNMLIEIEIERRARYRDAVNQYPQVGDLQAQIEQISGELDTLVSGVKERRRQTRKRVKDEGTQNRIQELKDQRRGLIEQLKLERGKLSEAPEVLAANQYGIEASKAAYNSETAPRAWGTRLRANEAAQRSFKTSKDDPRFLRWDGTGELAVQIQTSRTEKDDGVVVVKGKLTTEGLMACQDSRARLEHCQGKYYRLHLRVDSDGRKPVWCTWPVVLHRPLPPGADIKWVVAQRMKAPHLGTLGHSDCGFSWQVLFVLESETFVVAPRLTGSVAAINFGFRKLDDAGSLRFGFLVGSDGGRRELVLEGYGPRERSVGGYRYPGGRERQRRAGVRASLQYADVKRSDRDIRFNEAKERLAAARSAAPEWLQTWTQTIDRWHSPDRLQRLRSHWINNRYAGDQEIFMVIDNWARKDRHDMQHEQGNRTRAYARRGEFQRQLARDICLQYREIRIPKTGLAKLRTKRRADQAGESELETAQRQQLSDAAVHQFIQALRLMASNTGAIIVECEATEITLRHYRCGQVDESDRASSILVECTHCKEEYDQDESAALNVLASATMPQDRQGPLAAE